MLDETFESLRTPLTVVTSFSANGFLFTFNMISVAARKTSEDFVNERSSARLFLSEFMY